MEETKKKKSRLTREDRKMILFMFWGLPATFILILIFQYLNIVMVNNFTFWERLNYFLYTKDIHISLIIFLFFPAIYIWKVGTYWSKRFLNSGE
ncbi:hypothetical protein HMPREF3144_01175 [Oligella sp. HMSC05A10]|uniref:hypothetical protein n=1 Tax=Oligella sp. HMSC05A10 TaxID=1581112 RepID=UPI0008A33F2F|nr:hypothetical protein [Oligella sp. HMSC05A10]OFS89149.1 hypothetical protein HMPREF3144_01175 [Oligella sp. HMSC05A10]